MHQAVASDWFRFSTCGLVQGLLLALEARDAETVDHCRRATAYALLLAERLGLQEPELLYQIALGAALHDVGKIAVPDGILGKRGKLTCAEMEEIRKHPSRGSLMLEALSCFPSTLDIVLYHHERFDGTGYPTGRKGDDIPLVARLFAVVDAFDAMTSDRPYRSAYALERAREELRRQRGTQFCPRCVDAFLSLDPAVLEAVRAGEVARHLEKIGFGPNPAFNILTPFAQFLRLFFPDETVC